MRNHLLTDVLVTPSNYDDKESRLLQLKMNNMYYLYPFLEESVVLYGYYDHERLHSEYNIALHPGIRFDLHQDHFITARLSNILLSSKAITPLCSVGMCGMLYVVKLYVVKLCICM